MNDSILSRTAKSGQIDRSVGAGKRSAHIDRETVSELVMRNRAAAAEYVSWRGGVAALSPFECCCSLIVLSEIVNRGISRNSMLRTWSIAGRQYGGEPDVSPDEVPKMLFDLKILPADEIRNAPIENILGVVAEIEWVIGIGPLHPFADGCGRTSRYFSTLMSIIYGSPYVVHRNRDAYYESGAAGRSAFQTYYCGLERVGVTL